MLATNLRRSQIKITNRHNLPDDVVAALSHSTYVAGDGDYSATTLLKPPRIVTLERRHYKELEQDCMDRVWSIFGQAAHTVLETHGSDDSITEERMYMTVNGKKIGGQVDNFKDGIVTDYKITTVWKIIHDTAYIEWEQQLNIYARLFRHNGYEVRGIRIVCILRDWDKNRAIRESDYPKTPILVIPLNVWTVQEQDKFLYDKVADLIECESLEDDALPICSERDRWCRAASYAVIKTGAKRATKVHCSLQDAEDDAQSRGDKYEVYVRPGVSVRCEAYCSVAPFCSFYKEMHKEDLDGQ